MPEDEHDRDTFLPRPLTLKAASKVKYFNFAITKSVVDFFFTEITHAMRGTIDMKHIKGEFSSKPLGVGWRPKFNFFSKYGHFAFQIKGNDLCSSMVANTLPVEHPRPQRWGQNVKAFSFTESSHVAYQIKSNRA